MKKYLFLLLGLALGVTVIGGGIMAAPQGIQTAYNAVLGAGGAPVQPVPPNVAALQEGIKAQEALLLTTNLRAGRALAILDDVRENGRDYSFSKLAQLQDE